MASAIATARVAAAATSTATSFIFKRPPLRLKQGSDSFTLKFNRTLSNRLFTCRAIYKPEEIQVKEEGQSETLDYRVFFLDNSGKKISPWHDIPLSLDNGVFNFIVEIPKESSAKMEVATDEPYTPIKQDTKKGKLRYYPYNINWNYGLLPQTWEDPSFSNPEVEGAFGDNDPVDVVEIGEKQRKIGEVLKVKPLAALAMIDEGELDWKIVAISLDDPKASLLNDINDVEQHFPGTLTAIRDWFRDYKIPDGKPANKFGLGNKAANKDYALKVITETNESWAKLVKRSIPAGELSLV
ncbi:Soluble inorganic pyrophosphatase 6, chloroplastic [Ancistrocladus abbreviatus]